MKILYEDSQILVCYKEAGLPVQTARLGVRDLESILKNYLREQTGRMPFLGVVHRLDQPVEGVLVFAKTPEAAAGLGRQVTDGRMKKVYRAVVRLPAGQDGEEDPADFRKESGNLLVDDLLKDGKSNSSRIVPAGTKGAKRAELEYRILKTAQWKSEKTSKSGAKVALVEICLHTGRHHQIRVQMAGAGMPLLGDRKYGGEENSGDAGFPLALCAVSLELFHPKTEKRMRFDCQPQGEYFQLF